MPNPFQIYPQESRVKAIRAGIVDDVSRKLHPKYSTSTLNALKLRVSKMFGGKYKRAGAMVVKALNRWLLECGLPVADKAVAQ